MSDTEAKAARSAPDDAMPGLRFDVVAGLTAASVVLPKAMAYATVASLPVQVGLYTAFIASTIYGLLGSSCVLSVSSTTTLAILTGTALGSVVASGNGSMLIAATATLTALVGGLLLLARALRLGFVANFISAPVLTGFKAGIGLVILLDQAPKLLGLHYAKHAFFPDLMAFVRHLPETHAATMTVGAVTIAALVTMEWLKPHSSAPLITVGAAILASWLFGLSDKGVSVVGHIPQGLPTLTWPDADLAEGLLLAALGIALMSFTESIAAARAFLAPGDPPINANRELVATGLANVGGALIGAMPAGGGASQTSVVRAAGGRTRNASLVIAAAALATMALLAPVLGLLPNATLAAVVIVYSASLIQPREFAAVRQIRTMEFRWAVVATLGVLAFGTLQGIVAAIVLSVVGLASQTANPRVSIIVRKRGADVLRALSPEHPEDESFEGLLILRPEGRLFFMNAQNVADQINAYVAEHKPRVVALDFSRVPDIEYSALQMLREGTKRSGGDRPEVWLAGLNPGVLETVRRAGLDTDLGRDRLLFNARQVIERYRALYLEGAPTGLSA